MATPSNADLLTMEEITAIRVQICWCCMKRAACDASAPYCVTFSNLKEIVGKAKADERKASYRAGKLDGDEAAVELANRVMREWVKNVIHKLEAPQVDSLKSTIEPPPSEVPALPSTEVCPCGGKFEWEKSTGTAVGSRAWCQSCGTILGVARLA